MGILHDRLEDLLLNKAYETVVQMIADKLTADGIKLTARQRKRLVQHLKSGSASPFRIRKWPPWPSRDISIELSEEEAKIISTWSSQFTDPIVRDVISSLADDCSREYLLNFKRGWKTKSQRELRERRGFEKRLYQHWGHGIDLLRMLLSIAREYGESVNTGLRNDQEFTALALLDVLTRLHARACQVTEEIVGLISAGFADGAMARWRTLHEIATVSFLLSEHGEELAKRYMDHQVVESYRAAGDYREYSERMGYEPMSSFEFDEIKQEFDDVTRKYEPAFKKQYGWAAKAVGKENPKDAPNMRDIERAAGIDHLRPHYRMASHNIHANPKGVYFKLGLIKDTDLLLAGPSNAGFADPGHSAAISLVQVSSALCKVQSDFDSIVVLKVLGKLEEEVGEALSKARQELEGNVGWIG